jgi:hypothetical protein
MPSSRRANRKNSRKNSRKASRKNSRKHGGRRNLSRKSRGVFSTLYSPASGLLRTASNVAKSGLNSAYAVPATFARGAKNTVSNSVRALVHGVDNIGHKATSGVNRALSSAFARKNSRKNRKNSRKNRKNSRKNRKNSRKNSRKNNRK